MTEQKELYHLANIEAPSGVPPDSADTVSQLESTAREARQPRLLVDLSEIHGRAEEEEEVGVDDFGESFAQNDDFAELEGESAASQVSQVQTTSAVLDPQDDFAELLSGQSRDVACACEGACACALLPPAASENATDLSDVFSDDLEQVTVFGGGDTLGATLMPPPASRPPVRQVCTICT